MKPIAPDLFSTLSQQPAGVLNAGYCTHFVWFQRKKLTEIAGFDMDWALKSLAIFHLETHSPINPGVPSSSQISKRVATTLLELLQRGLPTLSSLYVEQAIMQPVVAEGLAVPDVNPNGVLPAPITYSTSTLVPHQVAAWRDTLVRASVAIDPTLKADEFTDSLWDSDAECSFFNHSLANPINHIPWQLFEPQRSLPELLKSDSRNRFFAQRVDFALASPKVKLIVEIDGSGRSQAQLQLDRARDRELSRNGWRTNRIPTRSLNTADSISTIQQIVTSDPYCQIAQLNLESELWLERYGTLALQTMLTPVAVARIQAALLLALYNEQLSLEQLYWRITILERDVSCAQLAVVDLVQQIKNILALLGEPLKLPEIQLSVLLDSPLQPLDPLVSFQAAAEARVAVSVTTKSSADEYAQGDNDIALDVSILRRQGSTHAPSSLLDSLLAPHAFAHTIRSLYDAHDTRRISVGEPIAYALEPQPYSDTVSTPVALRYFVQNVFRKPDLRPGQYPIIQRALALQPVIGLLPTGAGKSLCYQLAALLQPGDIGYRSDPFAHSGSDRQYARQLCTRLVSSDFLPARHK